MLESPVDINMMPVHSDTSLTTDSAAITPPLLTRADFAAVLLLVASLVGMFWKVLFTSAVFFYRDVCNYTYPTTYLIRELCRHGSLPYWNPYLNFGQPVLGNPNLLFFYPSTLLILLLPFDLAYTLHYVLHFALAAVGVYVLARKRGQSYLAAFFAAFIFVFSGQVLSLGNVYNTVACAAWIPWAFLATGRALESKRLRPWIVLVVVFSLQWLAAEPFTMMATFGLCCAYALYLCGARDRVWSKTNIRLLTIFFLVGCGILLLCAVQFLPGADLLNHSRRGSGLSFRDATLWSVNPLSILLVLTQNFSGTVLAGPPGWIWLMSDQNDAYNISDFLGFAPLFFALAGWAMSRDRRRNFAAGAMGILLLLSLGHFTPVFALARLILPVLTVVRFPIKLLVHVVFLVAILAGWGFDALRTVVLPWKPPQRLTLPLQIFLGCTVLALGVAWLAPSVIVSSELWEFHRIAKAPFDLDKIPDYLVSVIRLQLPGLAGLCLGGILLITGLAQGKKWARPGLYAFALLAMGQLVMVNFDANPTIPKSFYAYRPPVLDEFKAPPGTYRFFSQRPIPRPSDAMSPQNFVNFQSIPEVASLNGMQQGAFQSRLQLYTGSMSYRVDGSINLDQERALPPFIYDVEIFLELKHSDPLPFNCLLGRLNVKYLLRPAPVDSAVTRTIGDVFNGSAAPGRLYEDLCFVPRTYVAGNSVFSTNSDETIEHLASPHFDALNTVILAAPAGSSPAVSGSDPAGQVEIVHRDSNSVALRAQLARPAYVLLLDRYDPNWQATIDGQPEPVLRANQVFRAVYAGAGPHEIRFDYQQRGLRLGLIISLLTLTTLAVLYFSKVEI